MANEDHLHSAYRALPPSPARHAPEGERGYLLDRQHRYGSQEAAKREVGNLADLSLPSFLSLVFAYIKPCSTRSSLLSAEPATRRLACERGDLDVVALKNLLSGTAPE